MRGEGRPKGRQGVAVRRGTSLTDIESNAEAFGQKLVVVAKVPLPPHKKKLISVSLTRAKNSAIKCIINNLYLKSVTCMKLVCFA